MPPSPVEELALLDLDRSNKGASKQRRDQINAEIARMRDLLPLPETARQRLSQLQIMSLSCVYIRKCNILHKLFRSLPAEKNVPALCDFFQALTGFLLITTREGKLVCISENVTDYLGHSMVDMKTQGDSLYDIVDKRDHGTVQAQLLQGGADLDVTRDVAFFCRMNMSRTLKRQAGFGDVKVMHVRGHFIPLSDSDGDGSDHHQQQQHQHQQKYVFMATCSPLITPELKENLVQSNTMVFKTVHQLDMSFLEVTKTAEYHLGYTTEEIFQTSWYSMLHPEDIHEAREKHILLIRSSHEMGCMMTVRMLCAKDQILWVNIVMHVRQASSTQNDDPLIVCINQVISEEEAYQIRMQSHMFSLYPPRSSDMWAAGLSGPHTTSIPQNSPPDGNPQWMPNTTAVAPPAHGTGYQGPVGAYYVTTQQRQTLPTCTVNYSSMQDPKGYHINPSFSSSSSPPSGVPLPPGHTDKLKLMLKRKIQGPCRPAKVPKLVWDEHTEGNNSGSIARQGYEYAATGDPMHSPDTASQFFSSGGSGGGYSWPASTHLLPQAQYRVAHVLPAQVIHQQNIKARLLSSPCPQPLSPPLSTTCHGKDQVVSDSSVAVPESYLTPDPSPASSPHPHTSACTVHTDAKVKSAPTSAAILHELEKLASLSPAAHTAAASSSPTVRHIKVEKVDATQCRHARPQRGLPVMDASDIESFFDTLHSGEKNSEALHGSKDPQVASGVPAVAAGGKAAVQPCPTPVIKVEPMDMDTCHLTQHQPTPESNGQVKMPQQSEMDPSEVEELLSYFSDDMTSTQLDLTDALLSSEEMKTDADTLVEMAKTLANGYRPSRELCSSTHLNHFLLHGDGLERPLEEFSPVSSTDMSSDANSEVSGDEESSSEEPLDTLFQPSGRTARCSGQPSKREHSDGHSRSSPLFHSPSHGPTHPSPQTPQDVPGINEEDELYQLNKLLSSMASDNEMTLSGEPQ